MEKTAFKQVPQGWIFGVPNPWLLGRRRYYLMNDAQKSEAAAELRRMWCFQFFAIVIVTALAVPLTMPWLSGQPTVTLVVAGLMGLAIGFVCNWYFCRKVGPIIAGLEPTTQRITMGDGFGIQVRAFSSRRILFYGLLSLALFALSALRPLLLASPWDLYAIGGAVLFGASGIYWLALYLAKRRQQPAT
jgi:drug/metabolite transporter (DMT)-like permease